MKSSSDEEMVRECILGNRFYQEMLYKKYSVKMYNLCIAYSNSRDEAKDIMQDGFVKVFASLKKYDHKGSLEGWVRKIIVNTAIDFYRKKVKENKHVNIDYVYNFPIENTLINEINAKHLNYLIHKLPEGAKLIFNLFVVEGYSHEEIAEKLNITTGTSKSQLSRAKHLLRDLIGKYSAFKMVIGEI